MGEGQARRAVFDTFGPSESSYILTGVFRARLIVYILS